jgi:hypothetical protein
LAVLRFIAPRFAAPRLAAPPRLAVPARLAVPRLAVLPRLAEDFRAVDFRAEDFFAEDFRAEEPRDDEARELDPELRALEPRLLLRFDDAEREPPRPALRFVRLLLPLLDVFLRVAMMMILVKEGVCGLMQIPRTIRRTTGRTTTNDSEGQRTTTTNSVRRGATTAVARRVRRVPRTSSVRAARPDVAATAPLRNRDVTAT